MNRSEVYGLWGDNSVTEEKKAVGGIGVKPWRWLEQLKFSEQHHPANDSRGNDLQTEAIADREDLGDIIVTLLIAQNQCLTKCNLRDAVFMWVHGRGCSQSWCRRCGSGTSS